MRGQAFSVYDDFYQLENRIRDAGSNTILVINFWATWCGPCVEELPSFEKLHEKFANDSFEVLLVSLDFKSRLEKHFIPFLEKNQLKSEVILLADQDADRWIPKMYPDWEGTIPATVLIRGGQRVFHAEQFENYEELESFVLSFLKKVQKSTGLSSEGTR